MVIEYLLGLKLKSKALLYARVVKTRMLRNYGIDALSANPEY